MRNALCVPVLLVLLSMATAGTTRLAAQPLLFADVTEEAGVRLHHRNVIDAFVMLFGTGAAWFDYDRDGDLDLYVTQGIGANALFRNNGDGSFTDVAPLLGVDSANRTGSGVSVADFNNDGWPDLYLANADTDVLFKNIEGTRFEDISASAGFDRTEQLRGNTASWGDFDNDGYLDLYIANHINVNGTGYDHGDRLYRNNGDETFTDLSHLMGTHYLSGYGFAGAWTDFDNDRDLDLILINDCPLGGSGDDQPTFFFRNDGATDATDWAFTEVSEHIGAADCRNGMGIAIGDYNRDGWMDYFYTNIGAPLLLRNDAGYLNDVTEEAGIVLFDPSLNFKDPWTWGANFFDYDLDGWQDLFIAAGILEDEEGIPGFPNHLYRNTGDGQTFAEVSAQSGVDDEQRGRTSIYGDYDGDGDPDLYLVNSNGPSYLFRNDNDNGHHWLVIDLEGTRSNRDGIGARLTLTTPDGAQQHVETRSGSSLGGGDDLAAYFGLGLQDRVARLEIHWPSGIVQTLTDLDADQRLTVVETADTGVATETLPPDEFALLTPYPNPFRSTATLRYRLETPAPVRLTVYDVQGRAVRHFAERIQPTGLHAASWDGRDNTGRPVAPGLYFARLATDAQVQTQLLIRH